MGVLDGEEAAAGEPTDRFGKPTDRLVKMSEGWRAVPQVLVDQKRENILPTTCLNASKKVSMGSSISSC